MKNSLAILFFVLTLSGCQTLADRWDTTVIYDPKKAVIPINPDEAIKKYMANYLKDPFSVQYGEFTKPVDTYLSTNVVTQRPTLMNVNGKNTETRTHAWLVEVRVNGKNGYGAYTGWKTHRFSFRGDQIVSHDDRD